MRNSRSILYTACLAYAMSSQNSPYHREKVEKVKHKAPLTKSQKKLRLKAKQAKIARKNNR